MEGFRGMDQGRIATDSLHDPVGGSPNVLGKRPSGPRWRGFWPPQRVLTTPANCHYVKTKRSKVATISARPHSGRKTLVSLRRRQAVLDGGHRS
jgi:hypothetical protein